MPRPVHFEIPVDNLQKAADFWSSIFGWEFQRAGTGECEGEYWLITTGQGEPGIDGGMMKRRHPQQPVVNTLCVSSVDEYTEKVIAAGGQVVVPKMAIPGVGWLVYFKDLDHNIFGMMENDPNAA